jgi:hypothetical protein
VKFVLELKKVFGWFIFLFLGFLGVQDLNDACSVVKRAGNFIFPIFAWFLILKFILFDKQLFFI